jgi:trans-aconitate methyltransferase
MSERSQHWEQVYGRQSPETVSWYQKSPAISVSLVRAVDPPTDARIVDVGGGASTLVDNLIQMGFRDVTVVDLAAAALETSRQRLAGQGFQGHQGAEIRWLVQDVTSWQPDRVFDIWHDRAVFHFLVEERDRRGYLAALDAGLRSGGTLIMATFAPDGPEKCSGLPVRRYSPETLAAELGAGFSLVETRFEDHTTPAGRTQRFVYCRFQKASRIEP